MLKILKPAINSSRPRASQFLFTTKGDPRENIMGFFKSIYKVDEKKRYGCLMVNAATEVPKQYWFRQLLDEMINLIERGFLFQLDRNDDRPKQTDNQMIARQLTLVNQGFWSMVRIDGSSQHLKSYLDSINHLIR